MTRLFLFIFAVLCIANSTSAQITYTWSGGPIGDYQVAANWSPLRVTPAANDILAFDVTTSVQVANVPNQTIGAIQITAGTGTVSFATNLVTNVFTLSATTPLQYTTAGGIMAGDLLTIHLSNTAAFTIAAGTFGIVPNSGGKIAISSDITLNGGTLDFDVVGSGGTTINSGGSIRYTSGVFASVNPAAITWAGGSDYFHNADGTAASAIPVSTWMGGSNCTVTGMNTGTIAPTGLTASNFSNFIWNCPAQSGGVNIDLGGFPMTINAAFILTSTNLQEIRFVSAGTTQITVGTYTQTSGNIILQNSTGTTNLTVNNSFTHSGGFFEFVGNGSVGGIATLNLKGNLTKNGTSNWRSRSATSTSQAILQFSGTNSQAVSFGGGWTTPSGGRFNIVNINTDPVGVSLNTTGTPGSLRVYNANSASPATCTNAGNFTGVGSITYGGGVGFEYNNQLVYNGLVPQSASSVEFPNTVTPFVSPANVVINNSTGVSFPASFNRWIRGTLTMQSGNLNVGVGNTLTLSNNSLAAQLSYTAGYISSGTLRRYIPASGLPTAMGVTSRYPFGTGINDRSVYLYFSGATITSADTIGVSSFAIVNASAIPSFLDNGITVDRRTNTYWQVSIGAGLNLGATTIALRAQANNIGSVDNISTLRLTDGVASLGTLITATGTTDAPLIGKSGLSIADIDGKPLYVGSDNSNVLQIVTFTWTGAVSTAWTNPANWTGGVGYPTSSTEIAIINTPGGNMPVIGSGLAINVYQLTVDAPASLTMTGTGTISVFDAVTFTGTAIFASSSKFIYASSSAAQNIIDLPYGTLGVTGAAAKILPATTTVTGDFEISGTEPTFGTGTFVYAAGTAPIQRVAANILSKYYNLTISGNRGGTQIRMGNGVSANTIDVSNVFTVTATNYVVVGLGAPNTFNFSSNGTQAIPGFSYGNITNVTSGGGTRILDPLGSSDAAHVINCTTLGVITSPPSGTFVVTGSKVRLNRTGNTPLFGFNYHDFEIAGNLGGGNITFAPGNQISIAGTFSITATNYNFIPGTSRFFYNGTGNQTIFPINYYNLSVAGTSAAAGTRIVTLPNTGTIGVGFQFLVSTLASGITPGSFSAGNGFAVAGSTVNFYTGSNGIPVLPPAVSGGDNYHHININGGVRSIAGDLKIGGNVTVTGTDGNPSQLLLGNNVSNRNISIAGNLTLSATSAVAAVNSVVDFNNVNRTVNLKLGGNLSINGASQLLTGNDPQNLKGVLTFNGVTQQYTNTSPNPNKYVNYIVGDGTNPTTLTLNSNLLLTRSGALPFSDSMTVANNAILNVSNRNILVGIDTLSGVHNPVFTLGAGATLATSNLGAAPNTAIEGAATSASTGSISSSANLTKNYHTGANYILNGGTANPFPAAISIMNNLTIGANVTLNKAIDVNHTLDIGSFVLRQQGNNLEFSGFSSTTGTITADPASALSINGTLGVVAPVKFTIPGGNTTGQLTINRPITVALASDFNISDATLTGNFITGNVASILDINGNTLTINGAVSGPGSLSGSHTSNLTLGGAAGTLRFTPSFQVLKNLSLVTNATASLGTPLDISAGLTAGNEGTLSVTGTSVLTTNGLLTLKSSADGTARVATGSAAGGYISGDVTVERYLSSDRSWRFLAAPAYGQTLKQAWQENQPAGVNGNPGFGTRITANQTGWAANGFDGYSFSNSLITYNPAGNNWVGIPNTSVPFASAGGNKAYMLFFRGDRSVPAVVTAPSTAGVLRSKGTLFQGNQPVVPVLANRFAAVGNNYASAIDFLLLPKTNLDSYYSVWDPRMPGANGLGAWVTFSASTAIPWQPIPSAAGASYTPNVANTRIESGQAFMVHSSGAAGSVGINETNKLSGSRMVQRPAAPLSGRSSITTNLYNTSTGTANVCDGNAVIFSTEFSNDLNGDDAFKLTNFGDNFGLLRDGVAISVDARAPVNAEDTIFYNMSQIREESYRLEIIADNFDNSQEAFLEDNYLHVVTPLNITGTTSYDFSVSSTAASAAANRFHVVFKPSAASPVAVTQITAVQVSNGIVVEWKVKNEIHVAGYDVEKSSDGIHFTKVYATNASGNNGGTATYNWLDATTATGDVYFRIKSIDNRGNIRFSGIVKVTLVKGTPGISVYPNPVRNGVIGVQFNGSTAGNYAVRLVSAAGQLISKSTIAHPGGFAVKQFTPGVAMAAGSYRLEVTGADRSTTVINILVQE